MSKADIMQDRLHRPDDAPAPSDDSKLRVEPVIIQVTQAFCPNGHNLMSSQTQAFDGQPGIRVWVSDSDVEGEVILSPYHGDPSRTGETGFKEGAFLTIACPICKAEFPILAKCSCQGDAKLVGLYLTPELDEGKVVAVCNVWGCHRSKVFDQAQLLSACVGD